MSLQALYDVPAPAKLNLFLHVTGRRNDGYHLLQSVFALIDWADTLHFERREDGGLRAWSEQVPGFLLSHRSADAVLSDVQPALEGILSAQLGYEIKTTPLHDIKDALTDCGVLEPSPEHIPDHVEYAALAA